MSGWQYTPDLNVGRQRYADRFSAACCNPWNIILRRRLQSLIVTDACVVISCDDRHVMICCQLNVVLFAIRFAGQ
jgi:hypothetical protein